MKAQSLKFLSFTAILLVSAACGARATSVVDASTDTPPPTSVPATLTVVPPTATATEVPLPSLSILLDKLITPKGITLDQGGDVDTAVETVGNPPVEVRSSGNGAALSASDGNTTADSYLQFKVDDKQLLRGNPTSRVRMEVEYFDSGTDTFSLEYDALPSEGSDGKFAGGGTAFKTDSQTFKIATFNLCDANFANRDNGADFRLSDNGDGAEFIRSVQVIGLPPAGAQAINVDDFGANPFDDQPDSEAIQAALDSTCSGDTIVFTSGVNDPAYKGYLIDKTLFLTGASPKQDLTFTASDSNNHALLRATADLKGYVVRLFARSRFLDAGKIDNIDFGHIDVNGGREVRICAGTDSQRDGNGDNWGSWLPECSVIGDPWCNAGNIAMDGAMDETDVTQDYQSNPSLWTTGIVVHDLINSQGECGSTLTYGSAAGKIRNVTIDTAGDHVHGTGCAFTDNDGDEEGWSDGITLGGPAQTVTDNTIINPSDVGIVYFGGKNTIISNNTIKVTEGNYGAFAGIALHPWSFGDVSGGEITGNSVTSEGDSTCGGVHAGVNIGPQMWGGACVQTSVSGSYGNVGFCDENPVVEDVRTCEGGRCQLWAYIPVGGTYVMKNNTVSGTHINYLVEGLASLGEFIDENNVSQNPQLSDWEAAQKGCFGATWGPLDKVAHDPTLPSYTDVRVICER